MANIGLIHCGAAWWLSWKWQYTRKRCTTQCIQRLNTQSHTQTGHMWVMYESWLYRSLYCTYKIRECRYSNEDVQERFLKQLNLPHRVCLTWWRTATTTTYKNNNKSDCVTILIHICCTSASRYYFYLAGSSDFGVRRSCTNVTQWYDT